MKHAVIAARKGLLEMDEQIENLKKDIDSFIQKDIIEWQKYIDRYKESDIMSEGFHNGRVSAFEEVLDLLENC